MRYINRWKDHKLKTIKVLRAAVLRENSRQLEKWGIQWREGFEWLAYLTEEVGELAEAITENRYRAGTREAIRKEAIQVATLALKIAEMNAKDYNP